MCPSGVYDRSNLIYNSEKKDRYKIIGFIDSNTGVFFYYGITRNYTTKYKHYYIWMSKQNFPSNYNNKLFNKIKELNYDFEAIELELLSKDYSYKEAKLYLQNNYLDNKCSDITNIQSYCFCRKPTIKHHLSKIIKKQIIDLFIEGKSINEISTIFDVDYNYIKHILSSKKLNKRNLLKMKEDLKNGMSYFEIEKKYGVETSLIYKLTLKNAS